MEKKKKEIAVWAALKAVITTAILILAAISVMRIWEYPPLVSAWILVSCGVVCISGDLFYAQDLYKKGFLKTSSDIFQIHGITFDNNLAMIAACWVCGILAAVVIISPVVIAYFVSVVAGIAVMIFGAAYLVIMRKDCKDASDGIFLIAKGYAVGICVVATGIILPILCDMFGTLIVIGAFLTDVAITAFYTYLDLKEWEYQQKVEFDRQEAAAAKERELEEQKLQEMTKIQEM